MAWQRGESNILTRKQETSKEIILFSKSGKGKAEGAQY